MECFHQNFRAVLPYGYQIYLTFSSIDNGVPISSWVKTMQETVPSQEQASKKSPLLLHDISSTLSSKRSFITTNGLLREVNHTLIDRSLDPIAQQQYTVGFELFNGCFCKILELNLWKLKYFIVKLKARKHLLPHKLLLSDVQRSPYLASNLLVR